MSLHIKQQYPKVNFCRKHRVYDYFIPILLTKYMSSNIWYIYIYIASYKILAIDFHPHIFHFLYFYLCILEFSYSHSFHIFDIFFVKYPDRSIYKHRGVTHDFEDEFVDLGQTWRYFKTDDLRNDVEYRRLSFHLFERRWKKIFSY